MESLTLLKDIVIIMAVAVAISIVFVRAGVPTVVGFLVGGVIIGPYGFGLVTEVAMVETLAEIGIVLLLFTVGLEFSIARMLEIKRETLLGGSLQVGMTVLFVWLFESMLGYSFSVALLLGFIVSLSSTAITLKLMMDSGEVNSSHGNFSIGVLLFQDLCVVLMVIVTQRLGHGAALGEGAFAEIAWGLAIALGAIAAIVVAASYLIPKLFSLVVGLRNREVFLLTTLLVCLGTAWLTSLLGLSLAVGAFIAGLVISESKYSHQIVADIMPFRDIFSSIFFISIGMLLELKYFIYHMPWLLGIAVGVLLFKALIIVGAGQILRYPLRLSIIVGLNLAQIGEFSFILIKMGHEGGLLGQELYQTLLAVSIITMALTPFIHQYSSRIAFGIGHLFGTKMHPSVELRKTRMSNHVVIVGYGFNGENLAKVLKGTAIPHLVLDINDARVKAAKKNGHRAYFVDAARTEVLLKMGVDRAKMVVLALSDPISTRRIVKLARELNPVASIVVRTRYIKEVEELYKLGANQVIPEEFETSVEIFSRVLHDYGIPTNVIQNQIDLVRQEGYAMLRHPSLGRERLAKLTSILEMTVMDTFYVDKGCRVAGRTIKELGIREQTGTTVIAVVRKGKARTNPKADYGIEAGDILVLLGSHAELAAAMKLLTLECPI